MEIKDDKHGPEKGLKEGYGCSFDDDQAVMHLQVPLKLISECSDQFGSNAFLAGFFEEAKSMAINIVYNKRVRKARSGILTPGGAGIPLKVH